MHNCLQGQGSELTDKEKDIYLEYNRRNALKIKDWDYDFIVIHDPQPAAMIRMRDQVRGAKWIWRCHIDTSTPDPECWDFIDMAAPD
ncbi:MAG TPA: glycosyl transferase family 1, partial [Peptococcaceae bacterium]|nr:glycosyl transferase family 1 [Peptococcaceae bacterium]